MYVVAKRIANHIGQILVIVLKNRSNDIRSNEIRIKRELPVVLLSEKVSILNFMELK